MYPSKPGLLIGFHGCDETVRNKIVNNQSMLYDSSNDYHWLGNRMYFWENNRQRALAFAESLKAHPQRGITAVENPAVLGAVIDLGFCLDLMDSEFLQLVKQSYETLAASYQLLKLILPANTRPGTARDILIRKLDCAVIENVHLLRKRKKARPFDSVRGVFVEGEPLYPTAGFNEKNHIQLCIRNPNCIKGFFIPREEDSQWLIP